MPSAHCLQFTIIFVSCPLKGFKTSAGWETWLILSAAIISGSDSLQPCNCTDFPCISCTEWDLDCCSDPNYKFNVTTSEKENHPEKKRFCY